MHSTQRDQLDTKMSKSSTLVEENQFFITEQGKHDI